MKLFSKQPVEPVAHPPVERCAYVRAAELIVLAHLDEYSSLFSPKRSEQHQIQVAASGDWTAIRLPDAVHPWQLHNLAFWMLDCPTADQQVIAVSAAAATHSAYWLVRDPEVPDALCGWDDDGNGWTVDVPGNDIVRPQPVPVPHAIARPEGFHNWRDLTVRLEDPGAEMNPTNDATFLARKRLIDRYEYMY